LPRQRFTPLVGVGGRWNSWLLVHDFPDQCDLGRHRVETFSIAIALSRIVRRRSIASA
jgi:hypothetical protein